MCKINIQDNYPEEGINMKPITDYTAGEMAQIITEAIDSGKVYGLLGSSNIPKVFDDAVFKHELHLPSGKTLSPETLNAVVDELVNNDEAFKPLMMYWTLLKARQDRDKPEAKAEAEKIISVLCPTRPTEKMSASEEEEDMIDYMLAQLDDGYIDMSSGHGDRYDEAACDLLTRILTEYKETHKGEGKND